MIPVLPGSGEIDRLQETVRAIAEVQEKLKPGVHIGFVLNRMEHNNLSASMPEVTESLNYPVISRMPRSVEYQRAFGDLIPAQLLHPFRGILEEFGL